MIKNAKIGVMILAAGSSSRLGYAKQLVEFKGKSLLQHAIAISEVMDFDSKVLVLGARKEEIERKIDLKGFEILINENWEEGMASSIRKGVLRSQELENNLDHIVILLSDQPFVSRESIEALIQVQLDKNSQATFSEYAGDIGVPAIFSAEVFHDLKELKGDQGAKKLIHDQKLDFEIVKFEMGNFDVDTSEDVELLKQMEE
ncbi:nucleotidyltransferase family protein [Subsaximicrobium wynnwilliamsii]|uniref:Nucleotidyltransferase family protein n=2 Tax=Subsaximicrobium wynnwilliamsii TaxID=291179 RepID=A0A5C6ZEA2_9FLAO|nr:nucleotidyltransferase family protein [Subsaximicrobium wynnwilliamsii]TXD88280.1 nucleotidyltransferase family protein [Subsaximicrobium wynnwilliamsii]TXE03001.1 nucleotidyltransferase family protein [Subsaximicrobium wynnwilliamsii]